MKIGLRAGASSSHIAGRLRAFLRSARLLVVRHAHRALVETKNHLMRWKEVFSSPSPRSHGRTSAQGEVNSQRQAATLVSITVISGATHTPFIHSYHLPNDRILRHQDAAHHKQLLNWDIRSGGLGYEFGRPPE